MGRARRIRNGGHPIGTEIAARAPADGYALLMASPSHTVNPTLKRSPVLPDVPTVAETLPGFESIGWYGVLAPAGTPREVITRLNAEINKGLKDLQPMLLRDGAETAGGTPEEFAAHFRAEMAKWAKVVREARIKAD